MRDHRARVIPFGDAALLIELGDRISLAANRRVRALAERVQAELSPADGWGVPTPAYTSLLVPFEPGRVDAAHAVARLQTMLTDLEAVPNRGEPEREVVEITVRYGGGHGPDLDATAERLGLTPAEVVARHTSRTYTVFMLGFAPGFAYLGTLPRELSLPRRDTPRTRVPAGSVAIAGNQTAVYPSDLPGGWHVLGRTEEVLWDPNAARPARLCPGDRVRFVSIDA